MHAIHLLQYIGTKTEMANIILFKNQMNAAVTSYLYVIMPI